MPSLSDLSQLVYSLLPFKPSTVNSENDTIKNDDEQPAKLNIIAEDFDGCTAPMAKRQKHDVADDLVCAISWDLPWEPVTAEDGFVYERSAIEKHINSKAAWDLRSPLTNEKMGKRLLAAPQHKNTIETLIETGVIGGDLAAQWLERKNVAGSLQKAEDGDVSAMLQAAFCFREGKNGFPKDPHRSFQWADRARREGNHNMWATAEVGYNLLYGLGVAAPNEAKGIAFLCMAAGQGSKWASYQLGMTWADGKHGLPVDKVEARCLLERALKGPPAPNNTLNDFSRKQAQAKLEELTGAILGGK